MRRAAIALLLALSLTLSTADAVAAQTGATEVSDVTEERETSGGRVRLAVIGLVGVALLSAAGSVVYWRQTGAHARGSAGDGHMIDSGAVAQPHRPRGER